MVVGFVVCYLVVCIELLLVDCMVNLIEECVDLVVCIVC